VRAVGKWKQRRNLEQRRQSDRTLRFLKHAR